MSKEDLKLLMASLSRIELLIVTIMKAKYGDKNATRVYDMIVDSVDSDLDKLFEGEKNDD